MGTVHLCVDVQRMFAEATEWHAPRMRRVLPQVARLVEARTGRTIFTCFIPAGQPGDGRGAWAEYHRRRAAMTLKAPGAELVELMPELRRFAPPARVFDKRTCSLGSSPAWTRRSPKLAPITSWSAAARPISACSQAFSARWIAATA